MDCTLALAALIPLGIIIIFQLVVIVRQESTIRKLRAGQKTEEMAVPHSAKQR